MATDRYFPRDTQTAPGTGGNVWDLSTTQGTSASLGSGNFNSTVFIEVMAFTVTIGDGVDGTSFPVSINANSVSNNSEWRYRVQRVNSSGAVQASSGYSATYTDAGVKTDTLTLSTTWAAGDRLRLSIEQRRSAAGGNRQITLDVNDASSYVDVTVPAPPPAEAQGDLEASAATVAGSSVSGSQGAGVMAASSATIVGTSLTAWVAGGSLQASSAVIVGRAVTEIQFMDDSETIFLTDDFDTILSTINTADIVNALAPADDPFDTILWGVENDISVQVLVTDRDLTVTGIGFLEAQPALMTGISVSMSEANGSLEALEAEIVGLAAGRSEASGNMMAMAASIVGVATAVAVATGALMSGAATISGTASIASTGATGALVSGYAVITGSADVSSSASGALVADYADIVGNADSMSVSTGVLLAGYADIVGDATGSSTAAGSLVAGPAQIEGQSVSLSYAVGSLVAQPAVISGTSVSLSIADGELVAGYADIVGSADIGGFIIEGSGALVAGFAHLNGSGTVVGVLTPDGLGTNVLRGRITGLGSDILGGPKV